MSTRVLVTGASGFVGNHLVKALRARGVDIRVLVRGEPSALLTDVDVMRGDLTRDDDVITKAVEDCGIVFHCAGAVGDRVTWELGKAVNVDATRKVARAAKRAGVRRFVHVSSVAVYGFDEGTFDESSARRRVGEPYIDTKAEGEEVCETELGDIVRIVRPAIIYGPGDTGMTPRLVELLRKRVPMIGSGASPVGLVHIDDVVRALIAVALDDGPQRIFNVMGPDDLTWTELVDHLVAHYGLEPARHMPAMVAMAVAHVLRVLSAVRLGPTPPPLTPFAVRFLTCVRHYPTVALAALGAEPRVSARKALPAVLREAEIAYA